METLKLLAETPVSHNLDMVEQVDDFIILIFARTNSYFTNTSNLEKFQKKILDVMGPLSAL